MRTAVDLLGLIVFAGLVVTLCWLLAAIIVDAVRDLTWNWRARRRHDPRRDHYDP